MIKIKKQIGNIIIGRAELRVSIKSLDCTYCTARRMKALGNMNRNIKEGRYFIVDKLLKYHTIKKLQI